MNILIVSRGYPTKEYPLNGIFEFDQAKALAKIGHRVFFVAIDLRSIRRWRKWGFQYCQDSGVSVFTYSFPVGAVSNTIRRIIGNRLLRMILKKINLEFDIMHAHFIDQAMIALPICKELKIPFIVTEHSSGWAEGSLSSYIIKASASIFQQADCVISVSKSLCETIKEKTGIKSIVVPNIAAMPVIPSRHQTSNTYKFVSAGNLIKRKGFDILLESFAKLVEVNKDVELAILGDGPEYSRLQALAEELGVSDKVYFEGKYIRRDFAERLNESNAFVLASRGETFGVVCIEAMTYGLPVVATICGGPENYITKDVGILVRTEDKVALFEAMRSLVENKSRFSGNVIKQYVGENFSAHAISNTLVSIYQNVIEEYNGKYE